MLMCPPVRQQRAEAVQSRSLVAVVCRVATWPSLPVPVLLRRVAPSVCRAVWQVRPVTAALWRFRLPMQLVAVPAVL